MTVLRFASDKTGDELKTRSSRLLLIIMSGLFGVSLIFVAIQPSLVVEGRAAQDSPVITYSLFMPVLLNNVVQGKDLIVTAISVTGPMPYAAPADATSTPRPIPPTVTPTFIAQMRATPAGRLLADNGGNCPGTYSLTVTIANRGTEPITDSFWVDLYPYQYTPPKPGQYGSTYFWADNGLNAASARSFTQACIYLKGAPGTSFPIFAQVDTDNKVAEVDETNNIFTATFILPTPVPVPTYIRPTPRPPTPTPYYTWPIISNVADSIGNIQNTSQGNPGRSSWPYPYATLFAGEVVTYAVTTTNPQSQTLYYRMEYCRTPAYPTTVCWDIKPWDTNPMITWIVPVTAVSDATTVWLYFKDGDPYLRYLDYDDRASMPYRIFPPPP